jgi:hypothetical protein
MVKGMQFDGIDSGELDSALLMLSSKLNLDASTVSDVRQMASRIIGGESVDNVMQQTDNSSAGSQQASDGPNAMSDSDFSGIMSILSSLMASPQTAV